METFLENFRLENYSFQGLAIFSAHLFYVGKRQRIESRDSLLAPFL